MTDATHARQHRPAGVILGAQDRLRVISRTVHGDDLPPRNFRVALDGTEAAVEVVRQWFEEAAMHSAID
jgi:hypothetical protein